ncbi:MAG: hypothetical protein A2136_07460 [Chloroflexi bacterium RBG_16_54_11]|nr:MAG: hypothetical protein A2136_07460 [Chloroflexi bacterium RBG_16_54_11]
MRTTGNKVFAVVLVIVTVLGLLLSLFFLFQVWRYQKTVTQKLQSGAIQTAAMLKTTEEGLNVIELALQNVYSSTIFIDDSAKTLAQTLESSSQFIGSASDFMGDSLISTITNTQSAIDSAQASAVVIDNILTTLSKVPLIGIDYNPSQPLNVALGEVSASLDPLQGSLKSFQTDLEATQGNMEEFRGQILTLDQKINAINKNLETTQAVIDKYQQQIKSLQSWTDTAKESLPRWVNSISWLLTLVILWLILIQAGILLLAINMLSENRGDIDVIRRVD